MTFSAIILLLTYTGIISYDIKLLLALEGAEPTPNLSANDTIEAISDSPELESGTYFNSDSYL